MSGKQRDPEIPNRWTEEEWEFLKQSYGKLTYKEMSLLLNRDQISIKKIAIKYHIVIHKEKTVKKPWLVHEDEYLKTNYGKLTYVEMALILGRTFGEIVNRCGKKLKIVTKGKGKNSYFKHIQGNKEICPLANKTVFFNDNFFEIPNLINSYWAGFLAADGNIKTNKKEVSLQISDKDFEHIKCFSESLNFTRKNIKICKKKWYCYV